MYKFDDLEINNFISELPFKLTDSQINSYQEILDDLTNSFPMKRLLQGDVGSGKTVVSAIAIYAVVKSGYQVAFMAPTEVLAEQHLKSISEFLKYSDKIGRTSCRERV